MEPIQVSPERGDDGQMRTSVMTSIEVSMSNETGAPAPPQPEVSVIPDFHSKPEPTPAPEVPAALKERGISDLDGAAKALESALKRLGDQGQELGQLRQAVLQQQENPKKSIRDDDVLADPVASVRELVQAELAPINHERALAQQERVKAHLAAKHPNWEQTVQDTGFQDWVKQSTIRRALVAAVDQGNIEAADELFGTWSLVNARVDDQTMDQVVQRDRAARAIATEGGVLPHKGEVLRASDLIELQRRNPGAYQARLPEINRAYREGRVVQDV